MGKHVSQFKFIWVGKAGRKQPEQELCERYLKRIRSYVKFKEIILKPSGHSNIVEVKNRDSSQILSKIQSQEYVILCDEKGKSMSSVELAAYLEKCFMSGRSQLTWVVGGSMGASQELKKRANLTLSFSKMTFPHALARIILYEQVYRALCLRSNHPYHHGELL
ncbi:MAG: 23S rRNA (pseudouridine(1915)-N(3))-methyltransferase RlmH [Acidobacteria bacterium]|nr:MAG: 23S rRNA (pseudouridine(1915)-N(3))-methyltransferase RlmH [Acidobacteriota bacterium]